jgi:hypothetical protein
VWKTYFHGVENSGAVGGLLLVVLAGTVAAGEPFRTQNQSPVSRLYGWPAGEAPATDGAGGFRVRTALDIANQSYEEQRGNHELVLDGETWVAQAGLEYRWANGWRLSLHIPWVAHRGGRLDRFIEDYHDAMGLPNGNRKRRPTGVLDYRYLRDGDERFGLEETTQGLGDVQIAGGVPLWRDAAGARAVDATASVKLPTGDSDRLLGSGSTDAALGLAASDFATLSHWALDLHAAAGVLAMTAGDVLSDRQRHLAGYGCISIGWRPVRWLQPRLQLDAHSPVFSGTGLAPLDRWAVQLVSGATVYLPAGFALDIAVAEDIAVETTPDVVFHLNLKKDL